MLYIYYMAPMKLERYNPRNQLWEHVGTINPGNGGRITNNFSENEYEVFLFKCSKEKDESTIHKSPPAKKGQKIDDSQINIFIAKLQPGDPPHEITVRQGHDNGEKKFHAFHIKGVIFKDPKLSRKKRKH